MTGPGRPSRGAGWPWRGASTAAAIGNDTGPMHLIAFMGCPSVALICGASAAAVNRPRGPFEGPGAIPAPPGFGTDTVTVLSCRDLSRLSVERVLAALRLR